MLIIGWRDLALTNPEACNAFVASYRDPTFYDFRVTDTGEVSALYAPAQWGHDGRGTCVTRWVNGSWSESEWSNDR